MIPVAVIALITFAVVYATLTVVVHSGQRAARWIIAHRRLRLRRR
jgi:hypothetical protein